MPYYADLHIHSCLSPCGDDDMTPGNICAMARLKGLDIIAVTDHNCARNLPAVARQCEENALVLLPGMEITTREEVHLLGYFASVEQALRCGDALRPYLPKKKNNPAFFGHQYVMSAQDEMLEEESALLVGAASLPLSEAVRLIEAFEGVSVPAHINRGSNGLLVNLGMLPKAPRFPTLEFWKELPCDPDVLSGHHLLHASDAHYLGDIREKADAVCLQTCEPAELLAWMRS